MERTAYAELHLLHYLQGLVQPDACVVGLILGQRLGNTDYILHFAKTPLSQNEERENYFETIDDVIEMTISEHARHMTRMLPGGLYVLGIFIVSETNVVDPFSPKLISIINHIQKRIAQNYLIYGNCTEDISKLVLHYSSKDKTYLAKTYNSESSNVNPVQFFFVNKNLIWTQVECKFDIYDTVPINEYDLGLPLKSQLKDVLSNVDSCLKKGFYIFNGLIRKVTDLLESTADKLVPEKAVNVMILLAPNCSAKIRKTEVCNSVGIFKINGIVACSVWMNPKSTMAMVINAIRQDIIRSLSSRLSMHFDSLTEGENGILTDSNTIHELPRRILISLPKTKVMLGDYLFPGEGPQEAYLSFQDVLDVTIQNKNIVHDAEGQADLTNFYKEGSENESLEVLPNIPATNKTLYILGMSTALLVLIIAILVHYLR